MRRDKKIRTQCVDAKKIQEFFNRVSEMITADRDKVWVSKGANGETSFIVGKERVRISASMMKGGAV